jgi:erythromycin esterase-like protein
MGRSAVRYYRSLMRKSALLTSVLCLTFSFVRTIGQTDPIVDLLRTSQLDLTTDGKRFLIEEGKRASFFALGGLHGDNETPALMQELWASLGYRYIVVEMSPWAANRLKIPHLRGGDIEEPRPHIIIRELSAANPQNRSLQSMVEAVKDGYQRERAPELLQLARDMGDVKDITEGGLSLKTLVLRTLEVEAARLKPSDRRAASVLRETFMKQLFLTHYRTDGTKPKVMAVFGQSHLGRGIDRRGVSTLGNFIAELAVTETVPSFHVELFAAGGQISFGGLRELDQRKDEPAFELLASVARYPATVFDLRLLRSLLRRGPPDKLSVRDASLLYSADSYDAVVSYRQVTPAK